MRSLTCAARGAPLRAEDLDRHERHLGIRDRPVAGETID